MDEISLKKFAQFVRDNLEYQIGNPSAWEYYDDSVSEKIRRVCNKAREIIGEQTI